VVPILEVDEDGGGEAERDGVTRVRARPTIERDASERAPTV